MIFNPPFQVPDEAFHFFRAYQVSRGKWVEEVENGKPGAVIPLSLMEFHRGFDQVPFFPKVKVRAGEILRYRSLPLDEAKMQFFPFTISFPYPPFPYAPQALGIYAGRIFHLSPFYLFYLGRALNFFLWVALMYWSIRIIPILPWTLTLLALAPISIQQAASLSPDAMTNGLAFFFIASILKGALRENTALTLRNFSATVLSGLTLTLCKLAYVGHALLFFLIPWRNFSSKRKYFLSLGMLVLLNVLALVFWLHLSELSPRPGAALQMQNIIQMPLDYALTLAKTLYSQGPLYLEQIVGRLGHLDTPLPKVLLVYYWLLLFGVTFLEPGPGPALSRVQKTGMAACVLFELLIILTGQYLTWTPQRFPLILGVQGRYFLPLVPLLFLICYRPRDRVPPKWIGWLCGYSVVMTLTLSLVFLQRRFYG